MLYHLVVGINQVKLHTAELGTFTTVGRTGEAFFGCIADSGITDAESTMHEDFNLSVWNSIVDGFDFIQ